MTNATPGRVIKFGETTTLRLNIPESWDVANMTEIVVSITDQNGTVKDTDDAVLYAATALDAATLAEATSIVLETGSDDLFHGDLVRIGGANEIAEVRKVISYDDATLTAIITPELEYAHGDEADVIGMFATFDLDLSDETAYPLGTELWARWTPDTADLEYVESYVVGKTAFAALGIWSEFEARFPTEYSALQTRDLTVFERVCRRGFSLRLKTKNIDIDKVQDADILQEGFLLWLRLQALSGMGDAEEHEFTIADKMFGDWFADLSSLPIWQDDDQDEIAEPEEIQTHSFCETARYF